MTDEAAFSIYAVPISQYATDVDWPFEPVAADTDAGDIADLLTPYGGEAHTWPLDSDRDAEWVRKQLDSWADRDGPRSSVLVWVGHGESNGGKAWLASFGTKRDRIGTGHNAAEVAAHLGDEWSGRQQDAEAWTLVLIEACGAERFVELVAAELLVSPNPPKCFALLGAGGDGPAFLKSVPQALAAVLRSYDNDEVIRIDDLIGRLENRLEIGRAIRTGLGKARPLIRPRALSQAVTATYDVYAEIKEFIAGLPPDQRSFFVPKAQGTELGEHTWYFEGRGRERRAIADWLDMNDAGLLAVTGPAGSGKSAVLGNVVVNTNPELRELLIQAERVERLPASEQPADNVFDAVVLLTGLSTSDVVERLTADLGLVAPDPGMELGAKVEHLLGAIERRTAPLTILVDALDEAQEPLDVAGTVLRRLAPTCRLLVGTRRSTNEGPDLPEPDDSNLLDALGAISTVTVGLDTSAVVKYVERRLQAARPDLPVVDIARRVGAQHRHFLYARLAVHEILAHPGQLTGTELDELLAEDHRGLFATAVRRLTVADDNFLPLLEALAHARGRGLPRADGVWATAAAAFGGHPGEADLDNLLIAAAPYVMLDGEAGQSTYRLAHQTFVEHFHARADYAEGHRKVAGRLMKGDWTGANFYAVRYTPDHLVVDADRTPPDSQGLVDLVRNAAWLLRAIELLGVDQTWQTIAAARAWSDLDSTRPDDTAALIRWVTTFQPANVVERALRRSRIALTRDPAQLPGQLHARLKDYGPDTGPLGEEVGRIAGVPWLRMVDGNLGWQADLESTYGTAGKVRGLGFGYVGDRPTVAIAIDKRVVLWDPRTGVPDVAATIDLGYMPTSVAVADLDGRPVVVTAGGYDGVLEVWDAQTRERTAAAEVRIAHSMGVGRLNDRLVIAGVPLDGRLVIVDAATLQPVDVPPGLEQRAMRGFGVEQDGTLLFIAAEEEPGSGEYPIVLLDPAGAEIWRTDRVSTLSGGMLDVMTAGRIGSLFVIVAGIGNRLYWFTEGFEYVEQTPYPERTRAVAVGTVDSHGIVLSAPDKDLTAIVQLEQIDDLSEPGEVKLSRLGGRGGATHWEGRFEDVPVPVELGRMPSRDRGGNRSLSPDRPADWPQFVAAAGELDGVPVLLTGAVEGAAWIWRTSQTGSPQAIAGPFAELPSYVLEQGWDLLAVKPPLERVTSVALGNLPDRGAVVASACGGQVRLYSVTDGGRIEGPADDAAAVECVALGEVNGRTVLVTGSTSGNLTVWDPAAGTRVAGLALDDPIAQVRIEDDGRIVLRTAGSGDYALELVEP